MRILFLLLITIALSSCTSKRKNIDFQQVLEEAQTRVDQAKSLSEDTLLVQALEHYQNLEPKDTIRLHRAIILTAYHYWWKDEKPEAYDLLETIANTDREALITLIDLTSRDNDFVACYEYLKAMIHDDSEDEFWIQQAWAALHFYLNQPEECERLFDNITQYIRTPQDSSLYWRQVLPNHADIISDYGKQEKAIQLQEQVLNHFMGKDSAKVAYAHASLARYHLLQNNLKKAEQHLLLVEKYANDDFRYNPAMNSYMQMLRSILNYALNKRINMKEWALYTNSLGNNAVIKQAMIDAKEENNRLLIERNLKLTIEKQRTELTMLYMIGVLAIVIAGLGYLIWRRKHQAEEKEEELATLRKLVTESQQHTEQKDDRFFKKIMLQQLGVIRMAASNPTVANQELIRRMSEIVDGAVPVDSLLNWEDLYRTIDYIYDDFYTRLKSQYSELLNEKEIQLCCLLRANFSTKEISIVSQQSVRTVYQRKSVIRQKLGMEEKGDIVEFLYDKKGNDLL
ncbi:MAG: hypothetical protein J6B31_06160 [Bacteroidaceae bacterium]|nr:hypothetical protein [Bacteroidaceae bacterium]